MSYTKTRNVSIGHRCPHLCNCGCPDRRTDKGKSKCPPTLSGGIKKVFTNNEKLNKTKNSFHYIGSHWTLNINLYNIH